MSYVEYIKRRTTAKCAEINSAHMMANMRDETAESANTDPGYTYSIQVVQVSLGLMSHSVYEACRHMRRSLDG